MDEGLRNTLWALCVVALAVGAGYIVCLGRLYSAPKSGVKLARMVGGAYCALLATIGVLDLFIRNRNEIVIFLIWSMATFLVTGIGLGLSWPLCTREPLPFALSLVAVGVVVANTLGQLIDDLRYQTLSTFAAGICGTILYFYATSVRSKSSIE